MRKRLLILASLGALSVLLVWAQDRLEKVPVGHTIMNAAGRVRFDAQRQGELLGYVTSLDRLGVLPFSGAPSEKTAYLTYRTEPFTLDLWANGLMVHARPVPVRGPQLLYKIYYNAVPNGDYSRPDTFSNGLLVATLRARGAQIDAVPLGSAHATATLEVLSTLPFEFQGRLINLGDLASNVHIHLRGGPSPGGRSAAPSLEFSYGGTVTAAAANAN